MYVTFRRARAHTLQCATPVLRILHIAMLSLSANEIVTL